MKFRAEHVFNNITVAEYEALYFDEVFNEALCKAVKLERKVIKRDLVNGQLTRILRISPDREIPGPMRKVIGADRIEYTEYIEYKWGSHQAIWRTESSILPDKVDARGTLGFEARGNGVVRWVEGEVKVKVFGVGGLVERFVVADVEKGYDNAAGFTHKWLAEHGTKIG